MVCPQCGYSAPPVVAPLVTFPSAGDAKILAENGLPAGIKVIHIPKKFWVILGLIAVVVAIRLPIVLFGYAFIGLGVYIFIQAAKRQQNLHNAVAAFSAEHGLSYAPRAFMRDVDGVIFDPKDVASMGAPAYDIIGGSLDSLPYKYFRTFQTIGAGDQAQRFGFTVLRASFETAKPRFLLLSKSNESVINQFDIKLTPLKVEGDFNKHFDLYCQPGQEALVLQIFNPGLMADCIDQFSDFSIELTPANFYIYQPYASDSHPVEQVATSYQNFLLLAKRFIPAVAKVGGAHPSLAPVAALPRVKIDSLPAVIAATLIIGGILALNYFVWNGMKQASNSSSPLLGVVVAGTLFAIPGGLLVVIWFQYLVITVKRRQ